MGSFCLTVRELSINEKNIGILKRYRGGNIFESVLKTYSQTPFLSYEATKDKLRPIKGKEWSNKPIFLFGCSVTYGNLLDDENNFSGILSKISHRPVYNMAYDGWGPAHMLKLLKDNKKIFFAGEPEYIIYTFIKDHKRRVLSFQGWPYSSQLYKIYDVDKNGDLIEVPRKYPFYWRLLSVKNFQVLLERLALKNEEYVDKLLFKIFEESVSVIKTRYPNSKLILLLYDVRICLNNKDVELSKKLDILTEKELNKFKELGFEVWNIEEISGKTFCGEEYHARCPIYGDVDYNHPSSKMWEEFTPKLVETLKL